MSRRTISVLSALVLASGVALAQTPAPPTGGAPAAPPAPAGEGSAVAPIEDAPPADMEGTSEDPDAPRDGLGGTVSVGAQPVDARPAGYPIEEAQRPITLPQNMSEISIAPHFQVKPYMGADALRARYGITGRIQLGLTYVMGGVFDDPGTVEKKQGFHPGKAGGLDVTVLLTNYMGVKVGLPVYFDPFAMSFAAGAPMKFIFEKFAIGGLDDVLNIRIKRFAPSYYQEAANATGAFFDSNNTEQSRGTIRIAGYAVYQHKPNLALIGRAGIDSDLGAGGGMGTPGSSDGGTTTFIRAGVQLTPKKFLDVGGSLGFDNLARAGSFGLAGFLAVRI